MSAGSLAIERVDFVGVPSRDMDRSRRFYGETLGLRQDERSANEFWAGDCHMAFFADPDGNELMLHRRYASYE